MTTVHEDATGYTPPSPPNALSDPRRFVVEDQLSVRTRQAFKMRVVDALADGARHVIVDASSCGYIDSSGLGVLVSLNKKCRDVGGTLVIEGLSADLRTWLAYVKLDTVLTIEPPITDAERG